MADSDRYHHGDLRAALLAAGRALLTEAGPEAVTLRAVARRAGVSHAAPYHHFPDKAHLIEALAIQGFDAFTSSLRAAAEGPEDPLVRLRATGIAYVAFAVREPALFRLMNRPELRGGSAASAAVGPVERAAHAAYRVLEDGVRAAREADRMAPGDARTQALAAWSLVHGLAVLAIDGLLAEGRVGGDDAERLADAVTGVLGVGLLRR